MATDPVTMPEGTCLALVASGHRHGWALVRELASDGEIGRMWSLSRPLTYRAIDALVERGWLRRTGEEKGSGGTRATLALTASGRRALARWLATPVDHVRDVRTELMVKLTLSTRLGHDARALLAAQRVALAPIIEAWSGREVDDLVSLWRRESVTAVQRFLDEADRLL